MALAWASSDTGAPRDATTGAVWSSTAIDRGPRIVAIDYNNYMKLIKLSKYSNILKVVRPVRLLAFEDVFAT